MFKPFIANKIVKASLLIFCFIFLLLGLLFLKWGVTMDDYGCIYSSKIETLKDIYKNFKGQNHFAACCPSNYQKPLDENFSNASYRPLTRVLFGLQYNLFKHHPLGYFLIMIFFHALNSVLIFLILITLGFSILWASCAAFFFAFHPSIPVWMGWIAAQNYTICLTAILVTLISFFAFLKKQKGYLYVTSILSYTFAIFLFELAITFPLVLSSSVLIQDFLNKKIKNPILKPIKFILLTLPYWGVSLFFILVKFLLFPISSTQQNTNSVFSYFLNTIKSRLYPDLTTFAVEYLNYSFIPSGNQILKGIILISILSFLGWLFYKNQYKKIILWLFFCTLISMWPAILCKYMSRYTYLALPYFVFAIALLFTSLKKFNKYILASFVIAILTGNILFSLSWLKLREKESHILFMQYENLAANPIIKNKILCFIGMPNHFTSSLAQAFWIRGINEHLPIYYDVETFTAGENKFPKKISINSTENGILFESITKENIWFVGRWINTAMGESKILEQNKQQGKIYKMIYKLYPEYAKQNVLFITWDYEKNQFKPLLNFLG